MTTNLRSGSITLVALSLVVASSSVQAEERCEDLFRLETTKVETQAESESSRRWPEEKLGRRLRFSTMNAEEIEYQSYLRVQMYDARDGRGQFLVIEESVPRGYEPGSLIEAALAFPNYFARFDIHAEKLSETSDRTFYHLMMPTSPRLNTLTQNGVRYFDIPEYRAQRYSEGYFQSTLPKGLIPLASRGAEFEHDRIKEHVLGGLLVPQRLFSKLKAYQEFGTRWRLSPLLKYPHLKRIDDYSDRPKVGAVWDRLTSDLGNFASKLAKQSSKGNKISIDDISDLAHILKMYSEGLRVGSHSTIGKSYETALQNNPLELTKVKTELDQIAATPGLVDYSRWTEDEIYAIEAIRIISSLTGQSESTIQEIWGTRRSRFLRR